MIKTPRGFHDITQELGDNYSIHIMKHDVIRDIRTDREKSEYHNGQLIKIYYFYDPNQHIKGRIFPNDELVSLNQRLDIIVQNCRPSNDNNNNNLDVNPYHDFYEGEEIRVRITRRDPGKDPSFKLFNQISGFIKPQKNPQLYGEIKIGDKILVETAEIRTDSKGRILMFCRPLEFLENTS